MAKTKWIRPKLIVLVRGDRQESILVTCKNAGGNRFVSVNGPENRYDTCDLLEIDPCDANCDSIVDS